MDVTDVWEEKMNAIKAYGSQFFSVETEGEPPTPISSPEFMQFLDARGREFGRTIGATYGEGFNVERTPGVKSLDDLI
jgi:hypothetical protein